LGVASDAILAGVSECEADPNDEHAWVEIIADVDKAG
jgi:hypothetical protein